jgi:undecaprenyl-diphosphatase
LTESEREVLSRRAVPLFVNPSAGTGPTGKAAQLELFGADTVVVEEVEPKQLASRIKRAVSDGASVVAVAGGDGSLHTAVNALAGTSAALAVVPTGTLNNFAHRLGINSLESARDTLRDGEATSISLGAIGDELFLNTVTFGEYARTVRRREKLRPFLTKWPAAFVGFLEVVITLRTFEVDLESGSKRVKRKTPLVWGGIGLGSFPRVDEALERRRSPDIEIAVLHARTPWALAAFMWRASMQMIREEFPVRDRALEVFQTRDLTLYTKRAIDGTTDGELVRSIPPVRVCIRDEAVNVLLPRTSTSNGAGAKS